MKDILTVMSFTMKEMVKRKSFIISTFIILVFIVIGFNIPNIINSIQGEDYKERLLIVDSSNIFDGQLISLNQLDLGYNIELSNITYDEIKQKLENDEIDSALLIEKNNDIINMKYILKSISMMNAIPQDLMNAISSIYSSVQIKKLGFTEEQLKVINPEFEFTMEQTEEEPQGNIALMMVLSLVLFYAIYFCAYQVSSSITTEKTSKIMETLVTSTKPKTIIWGKTIGIGLVGIIQLLLIIITAVICANIFMEKELIDSVLDMSNITPVLGVITIIYFALGYLAYALLYALTGSTVSKPEDIQSANSPVAIISLAGFYLAYFTMMNPNSELNSFAALCPISSPFCMPFRVMMGLASYTDVAVSVAILIITILIIAQIAIKIYSSAILNYGTKITFKDMIKIYKDK